MMRSEYVIVIGCHPLARPQPAAGHPTQGVCSSSPASRADSIKWATAVASPAGSWSTWRSATRARANSGVHLPRRASSVKPCSVRVATRSTQTSTDEREDRVVEALEPRRRAEGGEEPRADDAVVHRRVPARSRERAGRGCRSLGDDRVLVVRRGEPRARSPHGRGSRRRHRPRSGRFGVRCRRGSERQDDFPAPGGPVTTRSEPTLPILLDPEGKVRTRRGERGT